MKRKQMKQIWSSMLSLMILLAFSPLAFAQGTPAAQAPPQAPTTSTMPDPMAAEAGGAVKAEKKGKKAKGMTSEPSNKGGELRGLDRADQRAGEHGLQGRDTARAKQGR